VRASDGWAPRVAGVLSGASRWEVIHADNADVLPGLADKSVAHVITDPPYEAEAHTLQRRAPKARQAVALDQGAVIQDRPLDFAPITAEAREHAAEEFARLSRGWAIAFCQVEAFALWRASFVASGAKWRRGSVWVKPDGMPQLTGDRPAQGCEGIAIAWCGRGRSVWNGGGRSGVFVHLKNESGHIAAAAPHPTTKPLSLMLELVSLFTDPDDVVLDPFCGSGTTGGACLRLGRRFIGVEKDAKYAAVARERLQAEGQGLTLRDARAGQMPMFPGGEP
jgi:site-specific DNA-methyltransferase (adenine-specific)